MVGIGAPPLGLALFSPFEIMLTLRVIGRVSSPLVEPDEAPKQGFEGGPAAWLEFTPDVEPALRDLRVGEEVLILTWLDRADRGTLRVHPRDDPAAGQLQPATLSPGEQGGI